MEPVKREDVEHEIAERGWWDGFIVVEQLRALLQERDALQVENGKLKAELDARVTSDAANLQRFMASCHRRDEGVSVAEAPNDIVGHKTFSTGRMGEFGPELRHEPLTRAEANALLAEAERQQAQRATEMPTDKEAIHALWGAHQRLKELGWREAEYCPKDGSVFDVIEAGSTGIHDCHYEGQWPNGTWWIHADGDLWPSRPILFRGRAGGDRRG